MKISYTFTEYAEWVGCRCITTRNNQYFNVLYFDYGEYYSRWAAS